VGEAARETKRLFASLVRQRRVFFSEEKAAKRLLSAAPLHGGLAAPVT
jgi:hypothetical protein